MTNLEKTNRVLSRAGARLVSDKELQQIAGGFTTAACVYDPVTCQVISGDCSKIPPACLGQ
jgi:bacteriocin-like protein